MFEQFYIRGISYSLNLINMALIILLSFHLFK